MSKTITTIILGSFAIFFVLVISFFIWLVILSNKEVRLRNQFSAQIKANEANYDTMWKTIEEKYNLSHEYKDGLVDVMKEIGEGRKGGSLFKSVTEALPNFDSTVVKDVMSSIEGKRNSFEMHQKKLVDIKQMHDNMRTTFPSSLVVGGRAELVLKMVTSSRTEEAFESGKDDKTVGN